MSFRPSIPSALTFCALIASPAVAQITTASIDVGVAGSFGCQGAGSPPPITGGYLASAHLVYTYDAALAQLSLEVTNTSPVELGVPNPLIAELYFNVPALAVTGLQLLSQTGAGGATPAFSLSFDSNNLDVPTSAGCLGNFSALLDNGPGIRGSIANALADTVGGPAGAAVIGPATFLFQLSGTNLDGLSADTFTASLSSGGPAGPSAAAIHFQAAGVGAEESGWLADVPGCQRKGIWVAGAPRIGSTVFIVSSGDAGCHGCLLISLNAGPLVIEGVSIPAGFPFLLEGGIFLTGSPQALPVPIPYDPLLIGLKVYFALVVFDASSPAGFSATQGFNITIQA